MESRRRSAVSLVFAPQEVLDCQKLQTARMDMGLIEQMIVGWINEDGDRLNGFLTLAADAQGDEAAQQAMREKFAVLIPNCGDFWRSLLLEATAATNWGVIIREITDRRQLGSDESAWMMVDRRES